MKEGERPKSPGMAYKHYSPRCRTALVNTKEEALSLYCEEEQKGGTPAILCAEEDRVESVRILSLGKTAEDMAANLYARLREGEQFATFLIAICPKERGGVMDGVLNRLVRACGGQV
jgi:L-threonylcarbamoyladenylate synthase